jgi:hypothetical protein
MATTPYRPATSDPALEHWRWRAFPELRGLGVQCLAQTRDGAVWFGTDNGVQRYDGLTWTSYTSQDGLPNAPVTALCATQNGDLYAGTEMGISQYKKGVWSHVFPAQEDLPWAVYDLMEGSDGSLWAGTAWGALRFQQGIWALYTTAAVSETLPAVAPNIRLFTVPDSAAFARPWAQQPEGIGVKIAGEYPALRRADIPVVVCALAPGGPAESAGLEAGDLILAIDGGGPVNENRLNGPVGTSVALTVRRNGQDDPFDLTITCGRLDGGVRDFQVFDVFEASDRTIWFGLAWGEVVRFTPQTEGPGSWQSYARQQGVDTGIRPRIAQTPDGAIWVASDDGRRSISHFDGRAWSQVRLSDHGGVNWNPEILVTEGGTLWVGGNRGYLHAYQDGSWSVYRRSPSLPVPSTRIVDLLAAADGALWIVGLGQEVLRLDDATGR